MTDFLPTAEIETRTLDQPELWISTHGIFTVAHAYASKATQLESPLLKCQLLVHDYLLEPHAADGYLPDAGSQTELGLKSLVPSHCASETAPPHPRIFLFYISCRFSHRVELLPPFLFEELPSTYGVALLSPQLSGGDAFPPLTSLCSLLLLGGAV